MKCKKLKLSGLEPLIIDENSVKTNSEGSKEINLTDKTLQELADEGIDTSKGELTVHTKGVDPIERKKETLAALNSEIDNVKPNELSYTGENATALASEKGLSEQAANDLKDSEDDKVVVDVPGTNSIERKKQTLAQLIADSEIGTIRDTDNLAKVGNAEALASEKGLTQSEIDSLSPI